MDLRSLELHELWVYLQGTPLASLILTLAAYQAGVWIYERSGRMPIANPVGIAVLLVVLGLSAFDVRYSEYFEGAQFIHFLLGTATVGLAIPIAQAWHLFRAQWLAYGVALVAGGAVSISSALLLAHATGLPSAFIDPLWIKSITAPIGMGLADGLGISPSLTAVYAVCTGVLGAVIATPLLNAMGLRDWSARGFGVGVAAHGIGTSRAFVVHPNAGALASLGMGAHGILGALLIPPLATLIR